MAVGAESPRVVMLSIDGLRPDAVLEADRLGLRIPALRRLLAQGAHARLQTHLPTVTYPGHTTLVTGYAPDRHGIVCNQPFDPLRLNEGGWMWYAEDIQVPTLYGLAGEAGMVVSSVDWPVTVGARIPLLIAQFWRSSTSEDVKLVRALSTPGLLAEVEKAIGPYPVKADYWVADDEKRIDASVYILNHKNPRLSLAYVGGLDEEEHHSGPFSAASLATLEKIDGMVDRLWKAAGPGAVFAVVSDHGFVDIQHSVYLAARLRDEGLITVSGGRIASWRASLWNALGTGAVVLAPGAGVEVRAQVRELLDDLARDPESGVEQILEGAGIRRLGGFPGADFVVVMRPGYQLSGDLSQGHLVRDWGGGTHGFSPELKEMDASLFIAGPGIPAGADLGRVDQRDVAPTLAGFLGLKMACDGRDLFAK